MNAPPATDDEVRRAYRAHDDPVATSELESLGAEVVVSGQGATLRTSGGRELTDFCSGGFGYGHPYVRSRVAEQMRNLALSTRLLFSRQLAEFVRRVAEITPGDLEVSYPCNSHAEAVEGALKLAKGFHPRRSAIAVLDGSFHGATVGALGAAGLAALRRPLGANPCPVRARVLPWGEPEALKQGVTREVAAVLVELVATSGGARLLPPEYLRALRERCTATGALLVVDETATNLGHTGALFAVNHSGVVPDVMVMGGSLGGGMLPMALYLSPRAVNDRVYGGRNPVLHGSTTGGNPAACVAGLAALEVVEREGLVARAALAERTLSPALEELRRRHAGLVSGYEVHGLLSGLRLLEPGGAPAVQRAALRRGLLVGADPAGYLVLKPPLLTSAAELARGLEMLDGALSEALAAPPLAKEAAR